MAFWIPWGIDAMTMLVILYFYFEGLADGTVSAENMGIWVAMLLIPSAIFVASVLLRSRGYRRMSLTLAWLLAIPGIIAVIFVILLLTTNTHWN